MKQYTKIRGIKIAYKGELTDELRFHIGKLLYEGITSGTVGEYGWWIIAKEQ